MIKNHFLSTVPFHVGVDISTLWGYPCEKGALSRVSHFLQVGGGAGGGEVYCS